MSCLLIPGPDGGVCQWLSGLSSAHSSDEGGSLWPWSCLLGPDGVFLDTSEGSNTYIQLYSAQIREIGDRLTTR